jgi:hypothetical protein
MLAIVGIDAVDDTLDAVLAQATVVMAPGPYARTGIDQEVSERVELRWSAWVHKAAPAHPAWCGRFRTVSHARIGSHAVRLIGQVTQLCSTSECMLGDEVVDSREIVPPRRHPFAAPSVHQVAHSLDR